ncbi:MAG: single-stranded DNA-binding protein [Oscillospiraceae bacterium]|jgi:hypothetical protein|nr:single-stranded DNA-binding protein [Oscillospiraceae bacterium]
MTKQAPITNDQLYTALLSPEQPLETLLAYAIAQLSKLYSGEIFALQDLFEGFVWKRITFENRLVLGKSFMNYISFDQGAQHARLLEKGTAGQRLYARL